MHDISKTFSIKRVVSMAVGVAAVAVSLLAGALTSAAAADEALPVRNLVAAPMVETGMPIIERVATNDMRVIEQVKLHNTRAGEFTAPQRQLAGGCTVEFDDSDALLIQPDFARNQFANQPWRERCGNVWTEVTGTKWSHLHLDFVADDIGPCLDGWDPLGGSFARLSTGPDGEQICTDFDPLTEPRTSPRSHVGSEVVRFKMYDIDGYQPFRLDRIRVKDQAIRLCAQPMDAQTGLVFGEAQDGALSGASCWTLGEGLWDLSNYTDNTGTVTMTGAGNSSAPFSFDDITITDQS